MLNKPKEQSSMKKKSIHDILPVELIHRIFLRVPASHLFRLRCVSKFWYSLISDPHFAELHFHHSPASSNALIFIQKCSPAFFVYLDALLSDNNDALQLKRVPPPFKMKSPPHFEVLGSCRGFVLLRHRRKKFLVLWNPLIGSSKRISYSRIVSHCKNKPYRNSRDFYVSGFGYDASQDDFLLLVACHDKHRIHFNCLSLRTNSWNNIDYALPKPFHFYNCYSRGLFLNGAIHWAPSYLEDYRDAILIFDLKERTFSTISSPEQLVMSSYGYPGFLLLGGCLALYYHNNDSHNTHIWVMKEYKVQSSWTHYQIPCEVFQPLCLSNNGDIIGRYYQNTGYFIYNVKGDLLKHFKNLHGPLPSCETTTVYRESLLPLPSDLKKKDNRPYFFKNVLNSLMLLKPSIKKDSEEERIQVNSLTCGEEHLNFKIQYIF